VTVLEWPTAVTVLGTPAPDPGAGGGAGTAFWTPGLQRHGSTPHQLFSSTAWINRARPTDGSLLVDPSTTAVIAPATSSVQQELIAESSTGNRPYMATTRVSLVPFTVTTDQPRVPIKMHTQPVPNYQKAMQQVLLDPGVRLPDEYGPQGDSDDEAVVFSPDEDDVWEFWRLRPITPQPYTFTQSNGTVQTYTVKWECSSSWHQAHLSTHPARSRSLNLGTYPNAPTDPTKRLAYEDLNMSVLAAKLPGSGLLLTREDCDRGLDGSGLLTATAPDHLLNLSVIYPQPSVRYWPASATDGFKAGSPLAEGMRLFLDQTVFTDAAINAMSVHPLCRLIMKFAVVCGLIIVDKSGSLEIDGEPKVHDLFAGTAPSAVLDGFPWGSLQVMAKTNGDGSALTDANPFPH
jgi:hypothetical protein